MTKQELIEMLYEEIVNRFAAMVAIEGEVILLQTPTGEIFRIEVKQK